MPYAKRFVKIVGYFELEQPEDYDPQRQTVSGESGRNMVQHAEVCGLEGLQILPDDREEDVS